MSDDQTSSDPSADELIVPAPREGNPGTADGVGEHVLQGMGDDGVRRIEGEFADLEGVAPTEVVAGVDSDTASSTQEG
jgi:hypothetical protein